jgi:menaquinone-dependent protoporphyrinogen IX oxidase
MTYGFKKEQSLENQILVAHAGKHGATFEMAEKIADVLQKQGLQTVCLPVNKVNDPVGDFRDWEVITAWANTISSDLKQNLTG